MSVTRWSGGVDLYAGLEFWMFFQPQSQGVDLYADRLIRGNIRYISSSIKFNAVKSAWSHVMMSLKRCSPLNVCRSFLLVVSAKFGW